MYSPLAGEDIIPKIRKYGIKCKFFLYSELYKLDSIEQLLPCSLILYQIAEVGHFCCVFKNDEGINFFDPLGFTPDYMLQYGDAEAIKKLHHDYTYLLKLLYNQPLKVIYNNHKLW